jgi:CRP/FNR family transcriptional regulator, cyclic AMP receptor protein
MSDPVNYLHLFKHADDAVAYPAGTILFQEGDPGEHTYVIKSGKVELKHGDTILETIEEGAIFGEMALLDGEKRSATAIAVTDCQLVPIDQRRFRFLVQQTPFFAQHVMKVMAARLRRLTKQLDRP